MANSGELDVDDDVAEKFRRMFEDVPNTEESLSGTTPTYRRPIIFRVPWSLYRQNEAAYSPETVDIGTFHSYGDIECLKGYGYKTRFLRQFLWKYKQQISAMEYVNTRLAQDCFSCYEDGDIIPKNYFKHPEFVKMMMHDCCFVFELIRGYAEADFDRVNDPVLSRPLRLRGVLRDLLLLENQLPYFMLDHLFKITVTDLGTLPNQLFKTMVAKFFNDHFPRFGFIPPDDLAFLEHPEDHLLALAHRNWRPSSAVGQDVTASFNLRRIHSATELTLSTKVKIKKGEQNARSLFDVMFESKHGILRIPTIFIEDGTETLLLNLMAHEQLYPEAGINYVMHYLLLMNCLIQSYKDVELLCENGIINGMGKDNKTIVQFFNGFQLHGIDSCPGFFYAAELQKMEDYGKQKRNQRKAKLEGWMLILKRDYFSNPWTLISVVAAIVLLGLTLVQTIYSVLSYYK